MFTFKKVKRTGRYRSFERDQTTIKIKRKEVGYMFDSRHHEGWRVRFAIKKNPTEKDPAPFKWIMLKARADSEKEMRQLLKDNFKKITEHHDLYHFED